MNSPASWDSGASMTFLGATDCVTGSRFLLQSEGDRVLVDCGLFQGFKALRDRNWQPLPVDVETLDAVVITHAHLDHAGYIPALVKAGYRGPIYATNGTAELLGILLPDSGHLLEEEARHWSRHGGSKHDPPRPLYTAEDALHSLTKLEPIEFDEEIRLTHNITATLVPAGHILGAAQARVTLGSKTVHFTGDLGRPNDPLMHPPRSLDRADILVVESTYGNRTHSLADPEAELGQVVNRVANRGGVLLIPAFAVGRTESILLHLSRLRFRGAIPAIPTFLNSPMAVNASSIYRRHPEEHHIGADEFKRMYEDVALVHSVDESKLLNLRGGPMIIVSASGMLTGGRILHHLRAYASDARNAIVLTGFQAGGTRGWRLAKGERSIRIFGEDVPVRAEVVQLESMSAHADSQEVLTWMSQAHVPPQMTYITHGEPEASDALRLEAHRRLGWRVRVPSYRETVDPLDPR